MSVSRFGDAQARRADLERQLTALRVENLRLRNLLKVTDGVEPPPSQPTLAPSDPGLVTNASPTEVKLALYARLFAARRDVYARYWENPRKGTKGQRQASRFPGSKYLITAVAKSLQPTARARSSISKVDVCNGACPTWSPATPSRNMAPGTCSR